MKHDFLKEYSKGHIHFYDEEVPFLLRLGLVLTSESTEKPRLVDLGCGDGRLIFALYRKKSLENIGGIAGVDLSESRITRLSKELPFVKNVVSDALNVREFVDSSFDYVICSQLIEHVEDDERLMLEIRRLLRSKGLVYVSSVIKKWHGVYFYFKSGSFRLDPTHKREYSSAGEFSSLIEGKGFEITHVRTRQVMFPLVDLILRLLAKVGLIEVNVTFYQQHKFLNKTRRLQVPVIGYSVIEVLAKKIG